MRHGWQAAQQVLVQRVEHRHAGGKQRAEDHTLGNAVRHPAAQPHGDALQHGLHLPHIARGQHGDAVAHQYPVDGAAVDGQALGAGALHQPGIMAHLARLAGHRVDLGQHVDVDQAVIDRSDQRIGQGMGEAREVGVEAGRVDDEEIGAVLHLAHRLLEQAELGALVLAQGIPTRQRQMKMGGVGDGEAVLPGPVAAVAHIPGHGLLAAVDVDRGDLEALVEQIDGQMEGHGRLARPALLIADHDHMHALPRHPAPTPIRARLSGLPPMLAREGMVNIS